MVNAAMTDAHMTDALTSFQLQSPLYASAAMRAIMSDRGRLQRMLDFEAALARAEAAVGVITATAAVEIGDACRADFYHVPTLVEAAIPAGNIAIAVVNALTQQVARHNKSAATFVHWGAASQDVIDTALVLELRAAIDALLADLDLAIKGFTGLAGRHRRTQAVARTQLQHALPMPFGLKLAGYAAALARTRERLQRLRRDNLALQFGGAAGTLAALGEHGFGIAERIAALLDLQLPDAPWHSHRDRLAEVAAVFGILAGTCGKIARDVALMMQIEVGEASEPAMPGRGVSSTLPHKRNPAGAAAALSAATIAPNLVATILAAQVQEHEGAVGGWQTEWQTFPTLALVTSGALDAVVQIAEGLEIDVERLRANLELSGGQIMTEAVAYALAEKIGRPEAHRLVQELSQRAAKEKRPLKEVLATDLRVKSQLSSVELEKLLIPLTYQGSAQLFIERLAVASQSRTPRRPERPEVKLPTAEPRLPTAPQLPPIHSTEIPAPVEEAAKLAQPAEAATTPSVEPTPAPTPAAAAATSGYWEPVPPVDVAQASANEAAPFAAPGYEDAPAPPAPETLGTVEPPPERPASRAPPPPADEDAPGAFMDVLSRAEAEAEAAALAEGKPKPS
jgi:3-carboxy-cis,cis-muconate cycloisomerase